MVDWLIEKAGRKIKIKSITIQNLSKEKRLTITDQPFN